MRISDWSSDVCSSDLGVLADPALAAGGASPNGQSWIGKDATAIQGIALAIGKTAYPLRSEERRVGKECVSTCRSRWSTYHYNKAQTNKPDMTTSESQHRRIDSLKVATNKTPTQ